MYLFKINIYNSQATDVYLQKDPDPYEERHPSRVDPEGQLGQILKSFFRKDPLVQDVFNNYTKENFFSRNHVEKDYRPVLGAALRLMLNLSPGIEQTLLMEFEGLTTRLYDFAETAEEPIRSYASGMLAVVMECSEVATEQENRF